MQLRRYIAVVRRRWVIVASVLLIALVGGALMLALARREYTADLRVLINRVPTQGTSSSDFRYDDYYRFVSTEYVLDDLVEEVDGNQFALAVLEGLHQRGIFGQDVETIQRAIEPERAHRILEIAVTTPSKDVTLAMTGVIEELLTTNVERFSPPDGSHISSRVIHRDPVAHSNTFRLALTYALQALLALILGLGLAFLVDFLDERVRDQDDAVQIGLPILARLPGSDARAR